MTSPNLGTKRICPKCDAKFYDFGAVDPIKCPKCSHTWKDGAKKKPDAKVKKEVKAPVKPVRKLVSDDLDEDVGLPDVEDGDDAMDLEPLDDESVELTSLEEVEEHEDEDDDSDPNSDDANDEMFSEMVGGEKLVDDLEDHMDDEEDEDEDDDSDDDEDDDEDDDDTPRKRRR